MSRGAERFPKKTPCLVGGLPTILNHMVKCWRSSSKQNKERQPFNFDGRRRPVSNHTRRVEGAVLAIARENPGLAVWHEGENQAGGGRRSAR